MTTSMREATLQTLGLGGVLEIFARGSLPAMPGGLVDRVFGGAAERGSLVISGAQGIVGSGKAMQLGSRLYKFGVPVVGIDFPGVPNGISKHYPGLMRAFGRDGANEVMGNIAQLHYDGTHLPDGLAQYRPRFLLEAIPEILDIKKAHYEIFRGAFPEIEIRSVTSGFPSSELGVGIAHPAFPHEINKVWEIVEPEPSAITQLFWALGLIPVPVTDHWSFVLDVLFCGITLAGLRYHGASNMPFWKIDKLVRKLVGPNPFRAHDAIGAKGANFLTWSCLHHLAEIYGEVFAPTAVLVEHKDTGQNWYPPNHFRPVVDWKLDEAGEEEFRTWLLGPVFQMTSLLVHERRGHLSHINAIGELCAQFRRGVLAMIRDVGADSAIAIVEQYHRNDPGAATSAWYPDAFAAVEGVEWQQLYVNAEHDGTVGVVTISRESYNADVNAELNRALDWLLAAGIERVIVTGDFHLSTQLVGADTNEFFPALENTEAGARIASEWSQTARRLHTDFGTSVGFINGKRCLGGMLELMMHCHYVVATNGADLGMPEVTLPVVPGMEGCHWPFRKARSEDWSRLATLLLSGRSIKAGDGVGWLIDAAAPLDEALQIVWSVAKGEDHGLPKRELEEGALAGVPTGAPGLTAAANPETEAARKAIVECVTQACGATLAEALSIQAQHSAGFMASPACRKGTIGAMAKKTLAV
jgi:enoyl-CoA hydratase/carnithine racemase/3-hydroxyacyl-CoA dehydrogenase